MTDTIKFIDVETADKHHTKVCQIGMIETSFDGDVLRTKSSLVNPETDFFYYNISTHGITSDTVKDAPKLPDVWSEFVSDDHVNFVCHNASSDISALIKSLNSYDIPVPQIDYADTMQMAKRSSYNFSNNGLETICDFFGVALEKHHDALCDAKACMEIYWRLYDGNHSFKRYTYKVRGTKRNNPRPNLSPYEEFLAIAEDVIEDDVITTQEARKLVRYITNHDDLMSIKESSNALIALELCVEDGYIDQLESDHLIEYLSECIEFGKTWWE